MRVVLQSATRLRYRWCKAPIDRAIMVAVLCILSGAIIFSL